MPTATEVTTGGEASDTWRVLLRTAQHWEVQDARNLLESEDVPAVVQTENFSGTYFEPFFQKHQLYVPENRVAEATKIIESTSYKKCLIDRDQSLENVSDWRYRDALLLVSGALIGLVDWIALYGLYLLDFLKNLVSSPDKDGS